MFHSAALKLTTWYLATILLLSVSLSLVIYHFSRNELVSNTSRQVYFFSNQLSPSDFDNFARLRQKQLDQGIGHLKGNLLIFNIMVLVSGGIVSYGLARRTLQPIEDVLESQKRFTGDASHELRTPLAVMQSEIEVALRNNKLSKAQVIELLKSNLEEVAKLKALSESLLRLASEENKSILTERVSLKEVVAEAVSRQKVAAKVKKINLKSDIADISVRGDQQGLAELVNLLLDNAIKYSPVGSQITLSSRKRGKNAYLSVKDQGRGIAAADLPRIFDRFYRADSSRTKQNANGYGLGLAIAKKIVDLHNGAIEVKSGLAKGSIFTIRLPLD